MYQHRGPPASLSPGRPPQNVVCTVTLGCPLDLKQITLYARNAEYNPKRFAAVIMRIRDPKTTGAPPVTHPQHSITRPLATQRKHASAPFRVPRSPPRAPWPRRARLRADGGRDTPQR